MGGEQGGVPVPEESLELLFWWLDDAPDRPLDEDLDEDPPRRTPQCGSLPRQYTLPRRNRVR
jgi:hypothetical protein